MSERESILKDKRFEFAVRIVNPCQMLTEQKEFVLSNQLLKCDESIDWLDLLKETKYIIQQAYDSLNSHAIELLKMIRSAIITTKNNLTHNS